MGTREERGIEKRNWWRREKNKGMEDIGN